MFVRTTMLVITNMALGSEGGLMVCWPGPLLTASQGDREDAQASRQHGAGVTVGVTKQHNAQAFRVFLYVFSGVPLSARFLVV